MYDKIQPSFSAGAIHPDFWHRSDLPAVQFGVKESTNTIFSNTGAWMMRPGTKYLNDAYNAPNSDSRLIPFYISDSERYIVEFSNSIVRVLDENCDPVIINIANYPEWELAIYGSATDYLQYETVRSGSRFAFTNGTKTLYIYAGYGCDIADGDIEIAVNIADTLLVSAVQNKILIQLANATPSKNTSALIQTAIRDLGTQYGWDLTEFQVVANYAYNAAPFISISGVTDDFIDKGLFYTIDLDIWAGTDVRRIPDHDNPISTDNGIAFNSPFLESDLVNLRFIQDGYDLIIVDGNHAQMVFEYFYSVSAAFRIKEYVFSEKPFISQKFCRLTLSQYDIASEKIYLESDSSGIITGDSLNGAFVKFYQSRDTYVNTAHITGPETSTQNIAFSNGRIDWEVTGNFSGESPMFCKLEYSEDAGYTWTDTGVNINRGVPTVDGPSTPIGYFDLGRQCMYRINIDFLESYYQSVKFTIAAFNHETILRIDSNNDDGTFDVTQIQTVNRDPLNNDLITFDDSVPVYYSAFNAYFGYPKLVYIFQDRLGFANCNRFPLWRFESRVGAYDDFSVNVPLQADDAMIATVGSGGTQINNIVIHDHMVVLMGTGEVKFIPDGAGYGPLNAPLKRNLSENGSAFIEPLILNKSLIYVSQGADRLRVADNYYTQESQIEVDDDITRFSHHLFDGFTILQLAYSRTPFPIIWAVRSDGKLLSCTFDRNAGITAWSIHDFGVNASVETIMVMKKASDVLYLVISRNGVRHIESLTFDTFDSISDVYRVDSGVLMIAGAPATTFDNNDFPKLAHLNTENVSILADGWPTTQTVQASALTFSAAVTKVIAGLPYTAIFHPLRPILDTKTGSGHAKPEKINSIKVKFKDTVGGQVGTSSTDLEAVPGLKTDPTIPEPLYTGWSEFKLKPLYMDNDDYDSSLFYYKQTSPHPATILALIPDVERT